MARSMMLFGLLIWQGWAAEFARAQATTPASTAPATEPVARYKVAYWFDRAWPMPTFRSQVYNLEKGEYDARVVDHWLDLMASQYRGYVAYVQDVEIPRGTEPAERDALATVIARERERVRETETAGPPRAALNPKVQESPPTASPRQGPSQAGPSLQPGQPAPNVAQGQRQVTNYIPIPDYAKLMRPTISGYDRARPYPRTYLSSPSPFGGLRGFGFGNLPSAPSYPFPNPVPYPRPHP